MTGNGQNDYLEVIRRTIARLRRARTEGEPSVSWQLGQIGVLGWIVVTPALGAVFFGRWLDHLVGKGVFWTASLLFAGIALGFWSAWRWMHRA
jgi:ATP synthase protein I